MDCQPRDRAAAKFCAALKTNVETRAVAIAGLIAPGAGGFIRVTMRSFANERKRDGLGSETPFTLTRMRDGDLYLQDSLTGRTMLLNAFGPSNEGVFAELIDHERTTQ